MDALRTVYIMALCYRATKATAVELAECVDEVRHDALTRLLRPACDWHKRLWQEVTQRLPLRGGLAGIRRYGTRQIWDGDLGRPLGLQFAPTASRVGDESRGANLDGWATTAAVGLENLAQRRIEQSRVGGEMIAPGASSCKGGEGREVGIAQQPDSVILQPHQVL
jgi:hypothetical protein